MSEQDAGGTDRDIFDLITADTAEGEEFAAALRKETETVEIVERSLHTGTDQGADDE